MRKSEQDMIGVVDLEILSKAFQPVRKKKLKFFNYTIIHTEDYLVVFTFAVSAQCNLVTGVDRVGEGVRVTGWFWFTYLFLDTFSFEMVSVKLVAIRDEILCT